MTIERAMLELSTKRGGGFIQQFRRVNDEFVSLANRLEVLQSLFNDKDPEVEQAIEGSRMENLTNLNLTKARYKDEQPICKPQ